MSTTSQTPFKGALTLQVTRISLKSLIMGKAPQQQSPEGQLGLQKQLASN